MRHVDGLDSRDAAHLAILGRPELGPTFTKVQLWAQLDLAKTVFLDADILVLAGIDDLFGREELSAAPDVGWPDCFNSGVFVGRPSEQTYRGLLGLAKTRGSFDGGDQGLLNSYFCNWSRGDSRHRLPFGYNLTFSASYGYLPALQHFKDQIKVVHFIGPQKPWKYNRTPDGRVISRGGDLTQLEWVQKWWDIHDQCVLPMIGGKLSGTNQQYCNPTRKENDVMSSSIEQVKPTTSFTPVTDLDFAHYRIKWTNDVENYFLKHHLSKPPSRTILVDEDSSMQNLSIDEPENTIPVPSNSGGKKKMEK